MKILVLGSNGQLGQCLKDQLRDFKADIFYASKSDIDIADFDSTKSRIYQIKPNLIINTAAYTKVDDAEDNKELAYLVNHLAVENIAKTDATNFKRTLFSFLHKLSVSYIA